MQIDFSDGRGKVYRTNPNGTHFVKLSFRKGGLYINRVRVIPSKDNVGEWIVYQPAYKGSKGWISDCEFERSSPLWKAIEDAAIKAVEAHIEKELSLDDDFDDIDRDLSDAFDRFGNDEQPP